MSSEYGFWGEMKLQDWESDAKRALKAIKEDDVERALNIADDVKNSYHKYWIGTAKLEKAAIIIVLIFIAAAVALGLAIGKWIFPIIIGVIGLVLGGFLFKKADKRKAVDNAFHDSYVNLMDAIKRATKESQQG